jgi:hypothetical protein
LHVSYHSASATRIAASILVTALLSSAASAQNDAEKPLLAVGEFGFVDTSGEPRDQRQ